MDTSSLMQNGVMIKKFIKAVFHKAYLIGKAEELRIIEKQRRQFILKNALIENPFFIDNVALIQNSQENKNKISIGKNSSIKGHLMLFKHGGEISIGDYCFVGEHTKIWSAKKISIGNRVLISHSVNIHDNISHPIDPIERHKDYAHIITKGFQEVNHLNEKEIIIEDDVWIGFNSTILKGVHIGKGAIIGACTLITKNVPANAVIVGNPATIIKYTQ